MKQISRKMDSLVLFEKNKKHANWLRLLVAAICLSMTGCKEELIQPTYRDSHTEVFRFGAFRQTGYYLVSRSLDSHPWTDCVWDSLGAYFHVYFYQDGIIQNVGNYNHSIETSLKEDERTGPLAYEVLLPTSIDWTRPYGTIAFTTTVSSVLVDNQILCDADLKRDKTVYIWDVDYRDKSHYEYGREVYHARPLMTIEGLYFFNNTSDSITIRHKGFEAVEKWYYTKATVNLTSSLSPEPVGTSIAGDVISELYKVGPQEWFYMSSKYVPTGKMMTDARLVLEIDGREVKTSAVSSRIEIKYAEYYEMNVSWDGQTLEWID